MIIYVDFDETIVHTGDLYPNFNPVLLPFAKQTLIKLRCDQNHLLVLYTYRDQVVTLDDKLTINRNHPYLQMALDYLEKEGIRNLFVLPREIQPRNSFKEPFDFLIDDKASLEPINWIKIADHFNIKLTLEDPIIFDIPTWKSNLFKYSEHADQYED